MRYRSITKKESKEKQKSKTPKTLAYISVFATLATTFSFIPNNLKAQAASCSYPSQILDLTNWKETLPTGSSGSPTEIKQTSLATFSKSPYFFPNSSCDGVIFRAPVNGVTTSGSGYPRSELREMTNSGTKNASWSTTSGTHYMAIDQAITAIPKTKKHVVAGQIHDANDDVIVIRLEYPKLFVDINGKTGPTLDANYTLGKRFTVLFVATEGKIKIYYNGSNNPVYTLNKSGSGMYFKAGAYTQSNCSKESSCSSSNYGEVVLHRLKVKHMSENSAAVLTSAPFDTSSAPQPVATAPAPQPTPAPTPTPSSPSPTTNPVDGTSPFEAESGTVTGGLKIMSDDPTSSGGKYVRAESSGSVTYKINVPSSGTYRVSGWTKAANGSSDSFYASIDGKSSVVWALISPSLSWIFSTDKSHTFNLSAGTHSLTLKYREKNAMIDRVTLVKQ